MFTGIITNKGKVISNENNKIIISNPIATKLQMGDSISVNGICLTVTETNGQSFAADYIQETVEKTNIAKLIKDSAVNLELPATPSSLLSGHIAQGHVDTTAKIKDIEEQGNQKTLTFELREDLSRYMVEKGSVTINGVSLTLIEVQHKEFSVGIIPHTWQETSFNELGLGDEVNIEVDVLAKYVEKLTKGNNG